LKTADLHYHTNIHRMSVPQRQRRMKRIKNALNSKPVDIIASTEHVYKAPIDAYLYLRDVGTETGTEVIAGIEALSTEGVEVIYLFRGERELQRGLSDLRAFEWSIKDTAKIASNHDCVTIVPHPFTMGQTGAGNKMETDEYLGLLASVDYVEIHNGSSLSLRKLMNSRIPVDFNSAFRKKIEYTYDLPKQYRGTDIGWAIGSDAHFPTEQVCVGVSLDYDSKLSEFDNLKRRIRFEKHHIRPHSRIAKSMIKNGVCVANEYRIKKTIGRFQRNAAYSV